MPAPINGSVHDQGVRRWLARADLEYCGKPQEILTRVLAAVGQAPCDDGLAALRFWGQTGDRPAIWIAAADPVHLEAQLDHLRLRSLWPDEWQHDELRQLFDELQALLSEDDAVGFIPIGSSGYFRSDSPMPTAQFSVDLVNGSNPVDEMPAGAGAERYQSLLSEIQMTMHQSSINQRREEQGLRAINSLWIWGGGVAAEPAIRDLPPLVADDDVLRGFWLSSAGEIEAWPGSLQKCGDRFSSGFVGVAPDHASSAEEHAELLTRYLRELRQMVQQSRLRHLTILFRQGLTAHIRPRQIFRVWRREWAGMPSGSVQ